MVYPQTTFISPAVAEPFSCSQQRRLSSRSGLLSNSKTCQRHNPQPMSPRAPHVPGVGAKTSRLIAPGPLGYSYTTSPLPTTISCPFDPSPSHFPGTDPTTGSFLGLATAMVFLQPPSSARYTRHFARTVLCRQPAPVASRPTAAGMPSVEQLALGALSVRRRGEPFLVCVAGEHRYRRRDRYYFPPPAAGSISAVQRHHAEQVPAGTKADI